MPPAIWKNFGRKQRVPADNSNNNYNNNRHDPWGNGSGPPDLDEAIKELKAKFENLFGGPKKTNSNGNDSSGGSLMPLLIILLLIGAIALWIFKSVNILDEKEKGVVLRLGKYHQTIGPGFNFNPWVLDQVYRSYVTEVREYPTSGLMLTEDENIVKVPLTVQYNIKSIKDFILNVSEPLQSLRHATDSAIRHAVGSTKLNDVLSEGRVILADEVRLRLQDHLDTYGTGIHVVTVTIQEAEPPTQVKNAFDDVIAAKEDKERYVNESESYRNSIIPEARGKAQRIIEEANAYKGEVVAKAEGESERFTKLLSEYNKAPEVTRERLYIDTLEEVLGSNSKVIVDIQQGNNMMYLPLDKLTNTQSPTLTTRHLTNESTIRRFF